MFQVIEAENLQNRGVNCSYMLNLPITCLAEGGGFRTRERLVYWQSQSS